MPLDLLDELRPLSALLRPDDDRLLMLALARSEALGDANTDDLLLLLLDCLKLLDDRDGNGLLRRIDTLEREADDDERSLPRMSCAARSGSLRTVVRPLSESLPRSCAARSGVLLRSTVRSFLKESEFTIRAARSRSAARSRADEEGTSIRFTGSRFDRTTDSRPFC